MYDRQDPGPQPTYHTLSATCIAKLVLICPVLIGPHDPPLRATSPRRPARLGAQKSWVPARTPTSVGLVPPTATHLHSRLSSSCLDQSRTQNLTLFFTPCAGDGLLHQHPRLLRLPGNPRPLPHPQQHFDPAIPALPIAEGLLPRLPKRPAHASATHSCVAGHGG